MVRWRSKAHLAVRQGRHLPARLRQASRLPGRDMHPGRDRGQPPRTVRLLCLRRPRKKARPGVAVDRRGARRGQSQGSDRRRVHSPSPQCRPRPAGAGGVGMSRPSEPATLECKSCRAITLGVSPGTTGSSSPSPDQRRPAPVTGLPVGGDALVVEMKRGYLTHTDSEMLAEVRV
jgi:hypothetical protein